MGKMVLKVKSRDGPDFGSIRNPGIRLKKPDRSGFGFGFFKNYRIGADSDLII